MPETTYFNGVNVKTLGSILAVTLALVGGCGGDDASGGGVAACKKHNEAAKKCGAEQLCENEVEAECMTKYPGSVCDNGDWGEDFQNYISCIAGRGGKK